MAESGSSRKKSTSRSSPSPKMGRHRAAIGWRSPAMKIFSRGRLSAARSAGSVTGFGFPKLLGWLGIERRLHTAGERKSMLDPFLPEDSSDVARLTALQQDIH